MSYESLLASAQIPAHRIHGAEANQLYADYVDQLNAMSERLEQLSKPIDIDVFEPYSKAERKSNKRTSDEIQFLQDLIALLQTGTGVLDACRDALEPELDAARKNIETQKQIAEEALRVLGLDERHGGMIGRNQRANRHAAAHSFTFAINKSPIVLRAEAAVVEIQSRIDGVAESETRLSQTDIEIVSLLSQRMSAA